MQIAHEFMKLHSCKIDWNNDIHRCKLYAEMRKYAFFVD